MEIKKKSNENILISEFIKSFEKSILCLESEEKIIIWLSWWNSLKLFYDSLQNKIISLDKETQKKLYFCFLDERVVDFEDSLSNYFNVWKLFLENLVENKIIKNEQIILPDFTKENIALDYYLKVRKIDIALFWVWEDWHCASLFPFHKLLENEENSYLEIFDSPKNPPHRITVSKNLIKNIQFCFVFFIWESKKNALDNFLNKNVSEKACPVKYVLQSNEVEVFTNL